MIYKNLKQIWKKWATLKEADWSAFFETSKRRRNNNSESWCSASTTPAKPPSSKPSPTKYLSPYSGHQHHHSHSRLQHQKSHSRQVQTQRMGHRRTKSPSWVLGQLLYQHRRPRLRYWLRRYQKSQRSRWITRKTVGGILLNNEGKVTVRSAIADLCEQARFGAGFAAGWSKFELR